MRWLRIGLAMNGGVFLLRGSLDILQPTSFYLEPDAPKYAVDAVRVLGITYISLGLVQLASWWVSDQRAVRTVAGASLLFAAGVFAQAVTQGSASVDPFHQLSPGPAVENLLVAVLYGGLLVWDERSQRRAPRGRIEPMGMRSRRLEAGTIGRDGVRFGGEPRDRGLQPAPAARPGRDGSRLRRAA